MSDLSAAALADEKFPTQLKLQCAEAVYKRRISTADKSFIVADNPYPRIKSRGLFPVGEGPSSNTL